LVEDKRYIVTQPQAAVWLYPNGLCKGARAKARPTTTDIATMRSIIPLETTCFLLKKKTAHD
jgi:hypothetical protein